MHGIFVSEHDFKTSFHIKIDALTKCVDVCILRFPVSQVLCRECFHRDDKV